MEKLNTGDGQLFIKVGAFAPSLLIICGGASVLVGVVWLFTDVDTFPECR